MSDIDFNTAHITARCAAFAFASAERHRWRRMTKRQRRRSRGAIWSRASAIDARVFWHLYGEIKP